MIELKDENINALKTKLHKTKRIMQVLTLIIIIAFVFFVYEWIIKKAGIDSSFSLIIIALGFFIIVLDKKCKKIKTELESRK